MTALKTALRLAAALALPFLIGCGGNTPATTSGEPPAPTSPGTPPAPTTPGGPTAPTTPGTPPGTSPPAPSTDLLSATPDHKMNSADLQALYKGGFSEFSKKYAGKVFDVTDVVIGYDTISTKEGTARLQLGPQAYYKCFEPHPMIKAMPGQTVTLRGQCKASAGILGWAIVKVEGDPPPTISAEQLVKDFKADEEATTKKYRDKFLIVTGTIQKVEEKLEDRLRISLTKPGEKPEVSCLVATAEKLKEGQPVRVLGQSISGDPSLSFGVLLPEKK